MSRYTVVNSIRKHPRGFAFTNTDAYVSAERVGEVEKNLPCIVLETDTYRGFAVSWVVARVGVEYTVIQSPTAFTRRQAVAGDHVANANVSLMSALGMNAPEGSIVTFTISPDGENIVTNVIFRPSGVVTPQSPIARITNGFVATDSIGDSVKVTRSPAGGSQFVTWYKKNAPIRAFAFRTDDELNARAERVAKARANEVNTGKVVKWWSPNFFSSDDFGFGAGGQDWHGPAVVISATSDRFIVRFDDGDIAGPLIERCEFVTDAPAPAPVVEPAPEPVDEAAALNRFRTENNGRVATVLCDDGTTFTVTIGAHLSFFNVAGRDESGRMYTFGYDDLKYLSFNS